MMRAVFQLTPKPKALLIDGSNIIKRPQTDKKKLPNIPMEAIVKGDELEKCIAAASIIAKV